MKGSEQAEKSIKIDWSKAPEWAGAVVRTSKGSDYYVSQWGGQSARMRVGSEEIDCLPANMNDQTSWTLVEIRPNDWNGVGLPPVKTVCEFECTAGVFIPVTILAHTILEGVRVAVFQHEDEISAAVDVMFRPTFITEQVVTDKRVLTDEAQADRDEFDSEDSCCSCHLNPPCGHCTHPGNPINQDDSCWMVKP